MARIELYAVAGNPILHSFSPILFRAAFEAAGISAAYTRLAAESAAEVIGLAREIGRQRTLARNLPLQDQLAVNRQQDGGGDVDVAHGAFPFDGILADIPFKPLKGNSLVLFLHQLDKLLDTEGKRLF